jgi:two-component system, chemotaxis family, chemotaxis protein CheY
MKCLVVDDSPTMRRIVVNALKAIGYTETLEAGDGVEALARCDGTVGLIITDWNMPNMGGLDLVKNLRARPETTATPILMVTTRSVREDILTAVQAGVSNYIVKPFTPQTLKEKIDAMLAGTAAAA